MTDGEYQARIDSLIPQAFKIAEMRAREKSSKDKRPFPLEGDISRFFHEEMDAMAEHAGLRKMSRNDCTKFGHWFPVGLTGNVENDAVDEETLLRCWGRDCGKVASPEERADAYARLEDQLSEPGVPRHARYAKRASW